MVEAPSPTIAEIKNAASETDARALLYIAVCELCDFFNVGKNMNDIQIATTVDLIIESFWHLKLEEIKFCFRRAMREGALYDRLDGNIILGWLKAYDDERTEEAIRLSEQADSMRLNSISPPAPGAKAFPQYVESLRQRAQSDPEAKELLESIENLSVIPAASSREERLNKDAAFRKWRQEVYLASRLQQ